LGIILVALWFWLNPRIFPRPKNFNRWISKGVLGEKLWASRKRYKDSNLLLSLLTTPFFFIALYTTYMKMFWATMFFAGFAFILKLWFIDRMVFYYEANKNKMKI